MKKRLYTLRQKIAIGVIPTVVIMSGAFLPLMTSADTAPAAQIPPEQLGPVLVSLNSAISSLSVQVNQLLIVRAQEDAALRSLATALAGFAGTLTIQTVVANPGVLDRLSAIVVSTQSIVGQINVRRAEENLLFIQISNALAALESTLRLIR